MYNMASHITFNFYQVNALKLILYLNNTFFCEIQFQYLLWKLRGKAVIFFFLRFSEYYFSSIIIL